jgi:hypothetical protein
MACLFKRVSGEWYRSCVGRRPKGRDALEWGIHNQASGGNDEA